MQNDEIIWGIIGHNHCSFRVTTKTQNFCRNEHNVTGLCSRRSCPLANSKYATTIEKEGICYLYIKVPERAHTPKALWEKIKLPSDYEKALSQIDERLRNFPEFQVHKNKQRLTKIVQYLIRRRKLAKKTHTKLVPVQKKTERRERAREEKAEQAAEIEISIEKELLDRLKQGVYGEIYNYPPSIYYNWLEGEEIPEVEYVEEEIAESELEIEDLDQYLPVKKKKYEYEYEQELEDLKNIK